MIKQTRKTQPFYIFADIFFMCISFVVPYICRYNFPDGVIGEIQLPNLEEYSFVFSVWAVFIIILLKNRHLYGTNRNLSVFAELRKVTTRIFFASVLVGAIVFFVQYKFFSRLVFAWNFGLLCVFLGGWRVVKRILLRKLIREGYRNINILVIGANEIARVILSEIKRYPYLGLKVVGVLGDNKTGDLYDVNVSGSISDFVEIAKKNFVQEIIVAKSPTEKPVLELIKQARRMQLGITIAPESFEEPLPVLGIKRIGMIRLLEYQSQRRNISEMHSKRMLDFALSLVLIIFLFIPCLIIAVLIKIDSPGPVFYVQKRLGLRGRKFNFYKFRSMFRDADESKGDLLKKNESQGNVMFKLKKDPRVTRLGKFLRKYSLDELPQLLNVLKGNMSLVGPRPPLPDEVEKYDYNHIERLSIKPGMTGLSQIRGRSDLSFSRWVKWDLWYINNWSFWLDAKVLILTIPTVLKSKGAY